MTTPTELIERMMALTEVEDFLAPSAPGRRVPAAARCPRYRGLAEIRAWAVHQAADPVRPQPLPVSVTETADRAVIRGQVRYIRGSVEKRHNVLEIAADLGSGGGTRERRIGRGVQLMRGLRPRRLALG